MKKYKEMNIKQVNKILIMDIVLSKFKIIVEDNKHDKIANMVSKSAGLIAKFVLLCPYVLERNSC